MRKRERESRRRGQIAANWNIQKEIVVLHLKSDLGPRSNLQITKIRVRAG